jgi:hypothetical protein
MVLENMLYKIQGDEARAFPHPWSVSAEFYPPQAGDAAHRIEF